MIRPGATRPGSSVAAFLLAACLLGLPGWSVAAPSPPTDQEAVAILRAVDDLWRAGSSSGTLRMEVKTAHYTRTLVMDVWSKGKEKSLVRIVSPLKEKDTASLKDGRAMYTYLPATDRTIRLTSAMMMASWMGSHLTNDDLVKESRLSDDYSPAITFRGERRGQRIIEFTLTPHPEAAVVWGKIVMEVTEQDHLPIIGFYYDEDGKQARAIHFTEIRKMGGRMLPTVLRVIPVDKPGEHTELVYQTLRFDLDLPDSLFSLLSLRSR